MRPRNLPTVAIVAGLIASSSSVGSAQPFLDTLTIGTTWYANQHNGTIGRMIVKDDYGYLHFVWTNAYDPSASNRHVWYSAMDNAGVLLFPDGIQIDYSERAGFVTLDVDRSGRAFPAFHETGYTTNNHAAVAFDLMPHWAAFTTVEPDWLMESGYDVQIIWPQISLGADDRIHLACLEYPYPWEAPKRQFYTSGIYDTAQYQINFPPEPDTWTLINYTMTHALAVEASDRSNRLAVGWTYCREEGFPQGTDFTSLNNDIYLLMDEDGLDPDFSQAFNLTNFIPPDTLSGNNRDTLRAYQDMCLFFDHEDQLHVAFTTISCFEIQQATYVNASLIWHWCESEPDSFHLIANAWDPFDSVYCGSGNVKAQRPCLAEDSTTGYLYCLYQQFDTDTSALNFWGEPSGEVYISVSTDGGRNWSVGTNVTHTITPFGAHNGECWSEEYPSMAKIVDEDCHIEYILNRDTDYMQWDPTIKYVKYQRMPIEFIALTPLVEQLPFHVQPGAGVENGEGGAQDFKLYEAFPNPFNSGTSIRFSLPFPAIASLKVYDVSGREVAALTNGWCNAGRHRFFFDGSGLASGIYIYRLSAAAFRAGGKMVLLK